VRWAPGLAALLALAALALASAAGVTQARYLTSASGGDSARVAAWGVEVSGQACSGSTYSFKVTNAGEVALGYGVTVALPSALPDGVSATLSVDGVGVGTKTSAAGTALTFPSAGTLAPGGSASCTLAFSGAWGVATPPAGATVSVSAEQVD
jgi:hypothetical protein